MAAPEGYKTQTMSDFVGQDFASPAAILIDQDRINGFAEATGDHQWIHVDVERARKESPFGAPIAHGFLTLSLLAAEAINSGVIPADAKAALNYGLGKVRFLAPVTAGSEVRASYKLASVEDKGKGRSLLTIESTLGETDADTPAVVAELMAMVIS